MIGIVYKVEIGDKLYIGSTTEKLNVRQVKHNYERKRKNYKLYQEANKLNIEKIICILLEEKEIENELEIRLLEQEYIDKLQPSLNHRSAPSGLIHTERMKKYYKDNKETINLKNKENYEKNKEKRLEKQKEYQENNKDKIKERQKIYRDNNKEKKKEDDRIYRENNKEKIREQKKTYRENNKEKIREQKKTYRDNNKEKVKEQQKKYVENNKEEITKHKNEKIECNICGIFIARTNMSRHKKKCLQTECF